MQETLDLQSEITQKYNSENFREQGHKIVDLLADYIEKTYLICTIINPCTKKEHLKSLLNEMRNYAKMV